MKYPIVLLSFTDHSANDSGDSGPYDVVAVGILVKETKQGYHLRHWVFAGEIDDEANVTGFVAKTPGLQKKVLSSITIAVQESA